MRKMKSTLRTMRPIARAIAEEANALDKQSRRLHKFAEQVTKAEVSESALEAMMVSCEAPMTKDGEGWPCPNHPSFVGDCPPCHTAWMNAGIIRKVGLKL